MTEVVIEVSVPNTTDIVAVADTVDLTPDPAGATVILVAAPGPPGSPGDGTGVFSETPSGAKNGINTTFGLAHIPRSGTTAVYRNGLREHLGVGYTESGSSIIFSTPPLSSDDLSVDYLMEG